MNDKFFARSFVEGNEDRKDSNRPCEANTWSVIRKAVNGQLQQLVASCGIDVGSIEDGVAHQLDASVLAWQSVNAAKQG